MPVMTGRPEVPLPDDGPLIPLARRLRELREQSGLSYREMAKLAKYTAPALSQAANGRKLAPLPRVQAYVRALGVSDTVHAEVVQLWTTARDQMKRSKNPRRRGQMVVLEESGGGHVVAFNAPPVGPLYFSADPEEVESLEEFAAALSQILSESGLTVRQVIENSSAPTGTAGGDVVQLSKTTTYDVLNGKHRPSPNFTRVFLRACGMPPARTEAWVKRLRAIQSATAVLKELTKQNDGDPVDLSRIRNALQHRWGDTPDHDPENGLYTEPLFTGKLDDFVLERSPDRRDPAAALDATPAVPLPRQAPPAAVPSPTGTPRHVQAFLIAAILVIVVLAILLVTKS